MSEERPRDVLGILAGVALVVICVGGSVTLFSWDADGAFAVYDGLWYAKHAEEEPWEHVSGHHPLFHVLLNGVTSGLAALEVPHPGHVGGRLIAGISAAWVALLLGAMAGPGRLRLGLLCALPLLATRGYVLEAATGENVLPACAAALLALWWATRRDVAPWKAGLALVIALGLRQDNILLVPGFALALFARGADGQRVATVARTVGVAGVATVALYVACWAVGSGEQTIIDWSLELAQREGRAWAPTAAPESSDLLPHLGASGLAVAGLQSDPHQSSTELLHVVIGLGFILVMLVGAALLRGDRRGRLFIGAAAVTILCRFGFYWWFEPVNYEWWLGSLTLIAGIAAMIVAGKPITGMTSQRVGRATLILCALIVAESHAVETARLREHRLARSRDAAIALGRSGTDCRYLVHGLRAHAALHMLDIPHATDVLTSPDPAIVQEQLARTLRENPVRTVILLDRWVADGMPWSLRQEEDSLTDLLDRLENDARAWYIREFGRVVVIGVHLDR